MSHRHIIRIVWDLDLGDITPGAHGTATDTSPPLLGLDPNDATAIAVLVARGLGIVLSELVETEQQPGELAAYQVRHAETGCPGRLTILPEGVK